MPTYLCLVTFSYIIGQVMLNIVGEFLLILRIESQHIHKANLKPIDKLD